MAIVVRVSVTTAVDILVNVRPRVTVSNAVMVDVLINVMRTV